MAPRQAYPLDKADAIAVEFEGGALATIASLGTVPTGAERHQMIHYFGSHGYATQDLTTGTIDVGLHNGTAWSHALPSQEPPYPSHLPAITLVELIHGASNNPAPGEAAARAVELVEAAYQAAAPNHIQHPWTHLDQQQ